LNVSNDGLTVSELVLDTELTVRVIVAVRVKPPEVPVTVTREFPVVAVLPAASVSVLVPVVLIGL